ncbi:tRNA-dihydrouridine synthase [bacterium]|jgi:tRNA-dihydrouridine synthase B|nr:tRNA-dihydrouridine synthase [bacterium]MBT5014843.1 tRNA-dihydrouridine synthase [bacterium]
MNYWQTDFSIGNIKVPRFISGPLDGYTDSPFRQLTRHYSPSALLYSEMRHVASVSHDNGAKKALRFENFEKPFSFQTSANSTDFIEEAVERLLAHGITSVDLNVGCPARAVVASGAGSELMANMETLEKIVKLFRKLLPIPFTVKMRAGFKKKNALEVARMLSDNGVDALAIHPRLQSAKFSGLLDYDLVAQIKKEISIPLIFSGDVRTIDDARMVYDRTGVDGFMIGRGMQGQPWKLKQLQTEALGQEFKISQQEIIRCALKHLDLLTKHYGDHGLFNFRKHIPFYIHDFEEAAGIRKELMVVESYGQLTESLNQLI